MAATSGLTGETNTLFNGSGNVGAVGTGVKAEEHIVGKLHFTKLTVNVTDAITVADNAAIADGHLLYTFPSGDISVISSSMNLEIDHADGESNAGAGEMALGTTASTGAVATIGASASTDESICGPLASIDTTDTGVFTVGATSGLPLAILSAGAHTVYVNVADTWKDVAGTDLDANISGTVTLVWSEA